MRDEFILTGFVARALHRLLWPSRWRVWIAETLSGVCLSVPYGKVTLLAVEYNGDLWMYGPPSAFNTG